MNTLFSPLQLGAIQLTNRMVMAPMTRSRATPDGVPTDLMVDYYRQRASAGLIISEGVAPSALGKGYLNTPGLYTAQQVAGWRKVTDAVHAVGGHIFAQIMHTGRIAHASTLPDNTQPVAPSAIRATGQIFTATGLQDHSAPRALSTAEVLDVIAEYRQAARLAMEAGFDGVELHAASGYLPEQFLSSGTNQREDAYGGSVENRTRFILEVLDAMLAETGAGRVGIKLSPEMGFNDIHDANPLETFPYLVEQMAGKGMAYLHVALFGTPTDYHTLLRPRFKGTYLIGSGLTQASAEALLAEGKAEAAVFGNLFLANPDLPERFRQGAVLNTPDRNTFYTPGAQGYTDYPTL